MPRREYDEGIIVYTNRKGKRHRLDGPAFVDLNGNKEWWVNGKRHRLDGPAIEYADGRKDWYAKGLRHRLDGPAIEFADGRKEWFVKGLLHRLDGPAYEGGGGYREWCVNGKRHRLDGPAIECSSGHRFWMIYNQQDVPVVENSKWFQQLNPFLKFTLLQNKSRKFNEWLFDPDHYAGKWHKKNMLRDFQ